MNFLYLCARALADRNRERGMSMKDGIGLRRDACQVLSSSWLTEEKGSQLCFSGGGRRSGRSGCVSQEVFFWSFAISSWLSLECDLPIAATVGETKVPQVFVKSPCQSENDGQRDKREVVLNIWRVVDDSSATTLHVSTPPPFFRVDHP